MGPKTRSFVMIPLILVLAGCSTTVIDKFKISEFQKQHHECFDGRYSCENSAEITVNVPECWRIVVEDWSGKSDLCVDEQTWKNTYVGQEWKTDG